MESVDPSPSLALSVFSVFSLSFLLWEEQSVGPVGWGRLDLYNEWLFSKEEKVEMSHIYTSNSYSKCVLHNVAKSFPKQ